LFLVAAATSVPLINSVMHYRNHEQHSSALAEHEQLKYVSLAHMSFRADFATCCESFLVAYAIH